MGEGQLQDATRKSTINSIRCPTDLLLLSPLIGELIFNGDLESTSSSPGRHLSNWEVSFIYVNVLYKKVTSPLFRDSLVCLKVFRNNRIKTILMSKRHMLGWCVLLPF